MSRSHGLLRLSEKIFNTPQLMTPDSFDRLTQYVVDRNTGVLAWQVDIDGQSKGVKESVAEKAEGQVLALNPLKATSFKRPDFSQIPEEDRDRAYAQYLDFIQYDPSTKLGVLNIEGTTVYRSTPFEAMCGMTSYQRLERTIKAQIAEGAEKVLMYVDSGGGEAYGCFEAATNLRALADKAGVQLVAYIDGSSGSAAYGLTSVAHEVIANPSSRIGSIGVVVSLMNDSKKLEKEGLERIYLYKGDNKVALDKDGSFSESFLEEIDVSLTALYQDFTGHVAKFRPMTVQDVIDTQASSFRAEKAQELGLVDRIMTRTEFFEGYLLSGVVSGANPSNNPYKMVAKAIQPSEEKSNMDINDIKKDAADAAVEEAVVGAEGASTPEANVLDEVKVKLSMDTAELEKFTADFEQMQVALASKDQLIEQLTAEKTQAVQALADFQQAALVADRREKLSSVLPSDRVDASIGLASKLSAEDFQTYFESLEATHIASRASMEEVGVKGEDTAAAEDFATIMQKAIEKSNQAKA